MWRTLLTLFLLAFFLSCTQTRDYQATPWFTVRQTFPKQIVGATAGPAQAQAFYTSVDGQWVLLGKGDRGRVLALDGGAAVLFATELAEELQLIYEGDPSPKPLSQIAPEGTQVTVSPEGRFLDFVACQNRGFAGCLSLELTRYSVRGRTVQTHTVALPVSETGCDYPALSVLGYDGSGSPYFAGKCEGMNPRCILVAPRAEGLFVRTRAKSPESFLCGRAEYWSPDLGAPLLEPERFTQLPLASPE